MEGVGSTTRKVQWSLTGKLRRTARHHRSLGNILPLPLFVLNSEILNIFSIKKTSTYPKSKPTTHNPQDTMFSFYICLKTLKLCFSTEILRWHNLLVLNNLGRANQQHQVIPKWTWENKTVTTAKVYKEINNMQKAVRIIVIITVYYGNILLGRPCVQEWG